MPLSNTTSSALYLRAIVLRTHMHTHHTHMRIYAHSTHAYIRTTNTCAYTLPTLPCAYMPNT